MFLERGSMSYVGGLKHLKGEDKHEILAEIRFFMSSKGFIDGIKFYQRMEEVLGTEGALKQEAIDQMMAERNKYKR